MLDTAPAIRPHGLGHALARKLYHNYADKRKEMRLYSISFLLFEESNTMKCLFTYEWVKLPRAHIPTGKGLMGSFLRLASHPGRHFAQARPGIAAIPTM